MRVLFNISTQRVNPPRAVTAPLFSGLDEARTLQVVGSKFQSTPLKAAG